MKNPSSRACFQNQAAKDGLKKSFLEKCSPVTMRDTGQRFREKRAFSEFP